MIGYRHLPALALALALAGAPAAVASPRAFVSGSYADLLDQYTDQPFVLSFWSLDCPPCYRELALWGELQGKGTVFPLVLVSTDTPADAAEIDALLARNGLQDVESWVFAAPAQQLRFEIDRRWQGELPRTYLVERGVIVDAATGVIDAVRLQAWTTRFGDRPRF